MTTSARRTPGLIAATTLLALAAAGCAGAPTTTRSTSSPVPPPHQRTLAENKASARVAARRALRTMPMPRGASRLRHSPVPDLGRIDVGVGSADPRLQQSAWWTVPADEVAFRAWLRRHHPTGMWLADGGMDSGTVDSQGRVVRTTEYDGRSTAEHTPVALVLEYEPTATGTAVRGTTFVSARRPRPNDTYLTDVRSADVSWRPTTAIGKHRPATRVRHLVASSPRDHAAIVALEHGVNRLVGSPTPVPIAACPFARFPGVDRLVFRTDGTDGTRTLTFRLVPFCLGQVEVIRNGAKLTTTLDPGDLDTVVRRLFTPR